MIACGHCPAPLPLQKPRDVTQTAVLMSLTRELTHKIVHTLILGGSLLPQSQASAVPRQIKVRGIKAFI